MATFPLMMVSQRIKHKGDKKMTKEMKRVNELINSRISCCADIFKLYRDDSSNLCDSTFWYYNMGEATIRINELVSFAYSLCLIDNKDCFIDAINEYMGGKRSTCPKTDDFRLDEMEMF